MQTDAECLQECHYCGLIATHESYSECIGGLQARIQEIERIGSLLRIWVEDCNEPGCNVSTHKCAREWDELLAAAPNKKGEGE